MSVLEIWGAEYQENNALLIRPSDREVFEQIAERENCPIRILGAVSGDGKVVVRDSSDGSVPVDLPLELVLGKMPQKTFVDGHIESKLTPLELPADATVASALDRVLRLLSVGSKRFLVHKVDRSVTVGCPLCLDDFFCGTSNHAITDTYTHLSSIPIYRQKGFVRSAAVRRAATASTLECGRRITFALWHDRNSCSLWRTADQGPYRFCGNGTHDRTRIGPEFVSSRN